MEVKIDFRKSSRLPGFGTQVFERNGMYTDFYKLRARPFELTPDHRFYFDSPPHRKALAYLTYGLSQGAGFVAITGEVGAGKTRTLPQ